jgi:CheY-like chemotaxis protein
MYPLPTLYWPVASKEALPLVSKPSVLIVDGSEENREVLETALERRGMRTLSAGQTTLGLELAHLHRPDLIVLDLEVENSRPEDVHAQFSQDPQVTGTPIVMLGSMRLTSEDFPDRKNLAQEGFVSKPYHYGPLIRRIEQLLASAGQPLARSA